MSKCNGFIWVETLISLNVFVIMMTTMLPIYTTIQKEKQTLAERSLISLELYNELHIALNDAHASNQSFSKQIANQSVFFQFLNEKEYVKGCASWKNAKHKNEERCLFGIPNE